MDTSRDIKTSARANLLLHFRGLLFEPHTSSTPDEVPDLVSLNEAGSDGHSLRRQDAVVYACLFRREDPPDFCFVCGDVIGVLGQLP
jgi:hypothetical protein